METKCNQSTADIHTDKEAGRLTFPSSHTSSSWPVLPISQIIQCMASTLSSKHEPSSHL